MLYIISTGNHIDVYPSNTKIDFSTLESSLESSIEDPILDLKEEFHSSCLVFIETYLYFDSRNYQSKANRNFVSRIRQLLAEGSHVIIMVPNIDYVDKRLREIANIIQLPKVKIEEEEDLEIEEQHA